LTLEQVIVAVALAGTVAVIWVADRLNFYL